MKPPSKSNVSEFWSNLGALLLVIIGMIFGMSAVLILLGLGIDIRPSIAAIPVIISLFLSMVFLPILVSDTTLGRRLFPKVRLIKGSRKLTLAAQGHVITALIVRSALAGAVGVGLVAALLGLNVELGHGVVLAWLALAVVYGRFVQPRILNKMPGGRALLYPRSIREWNSAAKQESEV